MQFQKNEIHIHVLSINRLYGETGTDFFLPVLSGYEKKRAFSFKFKKHQDAFIFSRGMLRHKLAAYTGIKPGQIIFKYREAGKPVLGNENKMCINFNISHSEDIITFAFVYDNELGIDVQHMRDLNDLEGMIQYNLSDSEQEGISRFSSDERKNIFYRFWTHKEAFIKATGEGLAYNLSNIEFSYENDRFRLNRMLNRKIKPADWSVFELELEDFSEYTGALIVENSNKSGDWQIVYSLNDIP